MSNNDFTAAKQFASLLKGSACMDEMSATVQRSHRFPLDLFTQIENMAKLAGVPVSAIINHLIECGLEAVKKELPQDKVEEIISFSGNRVTGSVKAGSGVRKPSGKRQC